MLAAVVSALLYVLVFPPFGLWPLVWIAPLPLALALINPARPPGILAAVLAGVVFAWAAALGLIAHWTFLAAREFFDKPTAWALGFTVAAPWLAAAVPLWFGLAFASCASLARKPLAYRVLGFGACWGLADLVREWAGVGNPWLQLGHGFWEHPVLAGLAAVGGVPLLSAVTASIAAGLSQVLLRRFGSNASWGWVGGLIAIQLGVGAWVATRPMEPGTQASIRVAAVQAALSPREMWDGRRIAANFSRYLELSRSMETEQVDLVVWPENAVPVLLDADIDRVNALRELAAQLNAAVLVGAPRSTTIDGAVVMHNSVYVFAADGSPPVYYDKRRLLPFLERDVFAGSAEPGNTISYRSGSAGAPIVVAGKQVALLLCFEALYASDAGAVGSEGAQLIVNLSNDAWFRAGAGPAQHFLMTGFRALEQGRPLVRVANAGPGGWFDSAGNAHAVTDGESPGGRVYDVSLARRWAPRARPDLFGLFAGLALVAALVSRPSS